MPESSEHRKPLLVGNPRPSLGRRISTATFNYGIGATLPRLMSLLLLPVYTRFLTPHDYGLLDLADALTAVLALAMRFGLPGAVSRFYYDHREGPELASYVSTVARF